MEEEEVEMSVEAANWWRGRADARGLTTVEREGGREGTDDDNISLF
jgi:hypothetical protein